jgi:outer membrane protein assembly factor BamB
MQFKLLLIAALAIPGMLFSQRQADWTVPAEGNPQQVHFQPLTGIAIVQTDKAYMGVDQEQKKMVWTIKRSAVTNLAGDIDYYNVFGTPYVIIRNSLLDSRDGKVLIDKDKEDFTSIESYEILPQLGGLLVRIQGKGMMQLYFIDLNKNELAWKTEVVKSSGIEFTSSNSEPVTDLSAPIGTTMLSKNGHIIYIFRKNLACLDGKTGKLLWVEKAEPAYVTLTPDEKMVLSIQASGGGLGLGAAIRASTGGATYDKVIRAFDLQSGSELWKKGLEVKENVRWIDPRPEYLVVAHSGGCNLYNYADAEPLWKKDFDGKRVVDVQANGEGYLVFFGSGYRSMQVDKGGKELWKKYKPVSDTEDEIELPEEGSVDKFSYDKGVVVVTAEAIAFYPKKGAGMKRWAENLDANVRMAYDPDHNNIVLVRGKNLLVVNPDKFPDVAKTLKINIEGEYGFSKLEVRGESYFMNNSQEYALLNLRNDALSGKYYKRPADGKAFLAGLASRALTLGGVGMILAGTYNSTKGVTKEIAMNVPGTGVSSGKADIEKGSSQAYTGEMSHLIGSFIPTSRVNAFKQSRDFAYFFTSDKKEDQIFLVKVNKDTGAETDKFLFDDPRPVYQVDEYTNRLFYLSKGTLKVFNM